MDVLMVVLLLVGKGQRNQGSRICSRQVGDGSKRQQQLVRVHEEWVMNRKAMFGFILD